MAKVAVIGGGVIGLTTAITLSKTHDVTILARDLGPKTNSRLATAVWHIYLIRGEDELEQNDIHLVWAEKTLIRLVNLASVPNSGVKVVKGIELFRHERPENLPAWMERAQKTSTNLKFLTSEEVRDFGGVDTSKLSLEARNVLKSKPVKYGYRIQAPAADMEIHLEWLLDQCKRSGVRIEEVEVPPLAESANFFTHRGFDAIVNCTGIDATNFADDPSFTPFRGEYFFVSADEDTPDEYVGDDDNPLGMAYSIPRFDQVAVGGLAVKADGNDSLEPTLNWPEVRARAGLYFDWLTKDGGRSPTTPNAIVGMRPVRRDGVRLEIDRETGLNATVIHNYGHGGSGWSMCWGCAEEVSKMLESETSMVTEKNELRRFRLEKDGEAGQLLNVVTDPHLWQFQKHFQPLRDGPCAEAVQHANIIADECGIEDHEFFDLAPGDQNLLRFWASQEAVTTNAFSQLLLICCSQIENVHARSQFMPVITGEHSHKLRDGVAQKSHPWLLKKLCRAIGIEEISISPADCTVKFLKYLSEATSNPFRGLGALGVGNERMLIPEYTAVMRAFEACFPDLKNEFGPFLFSNIHEDETHSELLQDLAGKLIANQTEYDEYITGAQEGVEARTVYYDRLVEAYKNQTWKSHFSLSESSG